MVLWQRFNVLDYVHTTSSLVTHTQFEFGHNFWARVKSTVGSGDQPIKHRLSTTIFMNSDPLIICGFKISSFWISTCIDPIFM
jgi:hypothetical protein